MQSFIKRLHGILSAQYILTEEADKASYLTDWCKRYTGKALAVVLPNSADEISQIVQACAQSNVAIVPQGGHTGFCGGATPDS